MIARSHPQASVSSKSSIDPFAQPIASISRNGFGERQSACSGFPRVRAVQYIRNMRGGGQAQFLKASDRHYYVVKFPNTPQGKDVLVREFLAAALASMMRLPVPIWAIVEVEQALIDLSPEMVMELPLSREPCQAGLCFGSRYPDYLGASGKIQLCQVQDMAVFHSYHVVQNINDFMGMLVFDRWTSNRDSRQVIFVPVDRGTLKERNGCSLYHGDLRIPVPYRYKLFMIDNGFCFGFTKAGFMERRELGYHDVKVYPRSRSTKMFEPWLELAEHGVDLGALERVASRVPAEWLDEDPSLISRILDGLHERRSVVRRLVEESLVLISDRAERSEWSNRAKAAASL